MIKSDSNTKERERERERASFSPLVLSTLSDYLVVASLLVRLPPTHYHRHKRTSQSIFLRLLLAHFVARDSVSFLFVSLFLTVVMFSLSLSLSLFSMCVWSPCRCLLVDHRPLLLFTCSCRWMICTTPLQLAMVIVIAMVVRVYHIIVMRKNMCVCVNDVDECVSIKAYMTHCIALQCIHWKPAQTSP